MSDFWHWHWRAALHFLPNKKKRKKTKQVTPAGICPPNPSSLRLSTWPNVNVVDRCGRREFINFPVGCQATKRAIKKQHKYFVINDLCAVLGFFLCFCVFVLTIVSCLSRRILNEFYGTLACAFLFVTRNTQIREKGSRKRRRFNSLFSPRFTVNIF